MNRRDLKYLYYIAPIENVPSILEHGILCHNLARKVNHRSVAMQEVQDRRKDKAIPGAGKLHDYANLYFNVRNPMMFKRKDNHDKICILAVDPGIIQERGVIVSDMNAAISIARFAPPDEGIAMLDKDKLFARSWKHPDDLNEERRHRGLMCAEVLVPKQISPKFIRGAFVSCDASETALKTLCPALKTKVEPQLFFC